MKLSKLVRKVIKKKKYNKTLEKQILVNLQTMALESQGFQEKKQETNKTKVLKQLIICSINIIFLE